MIQSRFNLFIPIPDSDKQLVYNTASNYLVEVNPETADIIQNISEGVNGNEETIEKLKEMNFIVAKGYDERKTLQLTSYIYRYSNETLGLTIAPTLNCNFRCHYCYEEQKNINMNQAVQQALAEFFTARAKKADYMSVTWYGGEPLLMPEVISRLSQVFISAAKEYKADYNAEIITNGYLIEDVGASFFKENQIEVAQVTLDGPREVHDSRRRLRASNASTFHKILAGIKLLEDNSLRVAIRCNVDKTNANTVESLAVLLKEEGVKSPLHLGRVYLPEDAPGYTDCYKCSEFGLKELSFVETLKKSGEAKAKSLYPWARVGYCSATNRNSFLIGPDGGVYKCWNDIGIPEKRIGLLGNEKREIHEAVNEEKYLLSDPFTHPMCSECTYLPICFGGCPYLSLLDGKPRCDGIVGNLETILRRVYFEELAAEEAAATKGA